MPDGAALKGLRILDLTQVAVGPYATLLLGFLGAEVIKVESNRRADINRGPVKPQPNQYQMYPDKLPGEKPWNRHAHYVQRNRNKLGISLDMATDEGKAVLLKLVGKCDALLENFRASVMDRWGLSYERLKEANPQLIYIKLSSQGNSGPERDYGSLGSTMECTGGLASVIGYLDGAPLMTNETYPDPVVGTLTVGVLLAAIRQRRKTGKGAFIDISQREGTTCLMGDAVLDYSMNGRIQGPIGNRHPSMAPHGVYRCLGEDNWLALSVETDEEWAGLCRAMGNPAWSKEAQFADAPSRWKNQDELDSHITEWTQERDHYQAMHILQAHGVAAGAVLKGSEAVKDPHMEARNAWDKATAPETDRVYSLVGVPWVLSKSPRPPSTAAPDIGEHNNYVYKEIVGLSDEELADLEQKGIIGTEPLWESVF